MTSSTIIKLIIGLVATAVWCGAIVGKHFWPDLDTGAIVGACGMVLTGLGIYHVASPDGADKPADKQAGRAHPALLGLIAIALLAGCSTVMRGYEAAAYNEIKSADDNTLAIWKAMACAMPVGAVLRSPDVIEAVNKLCGGSQAQLGAQQPITINVTVPAVAASAAK